MALAEAAAEAAAAEQAAREAISASDAQTTAALTSSSALLAVLANNHRAIWRFRIFRPVTRLVRRNRAEALKGSGELEPLVEMQTEQVRYGPDDDTDPS